RRPRYSRVGEASASVVNGAPISLAWRATLFGDPRATGALSRVTATGKGRDWQPFGCWVASLARDHPQGRARSWLGPDHPAQLTDLPTPRRRNFLRRSHFSPRRTHGNSSPRATERVTG